MKPKLHWVTLVGEKVMLVLIALYWMLWPQREYVSLLGATCLGGGMNGNKLSEKLWDPELGVQSDLGPNLRRSGSRMGVPQLTPMQMCTMTPGL